MGPAFHSRGIIVRNLHSLLNLSGTMANTLVNKSDIVRLKSKFFIYRAVIYASFLLIPVWIQKSVSLHPIAQILLMILYIMFMTGQWFLLGKEIDHRFKIYFRINSSVDRIVYRLFMGMFFMLIYFNFLNLLSPKWIYNCFWMTWIVLGFYYSWPTRGKIIQESVTTNFGEFRYLDAFEKTVLFLVLGFIVISIPEFPQFLDQGTLKLFFDPMEHISRYYWNFLKINYYPFKNYPTLFRLAWCTHFYLINIGLFLSLLYAFLRYFVSRRLSLLGVFAFVSSWSFSKILGEHFGASISTTYSLLWVWSIMWITRSSSYRMGSFLGLVAFWGTMINQSYFVLGILQIVLLYYFLLGHKTKWFRKKFLRYSVLGICLSLLVMITSHSPFDNISGLDFSYFEAIVKVIRVKAFFSLAIIGLLIFIWKIINPKHKLVLHMKMESPIVLGYLMLLLIIYSIIFDSSLVTQFGMMWMLILFSLLPLELLFQNINRLRSRRNMIYMVYIIICLLDSHIEGRLKIFLRLFYS